MTSKRTLLFQILACLAIILVACTSTSSKAALSGREPTIEPLSAVRSVSPEPGAICTATPVSTPLPPVKASPTPTDPPPSLSIGTLFPLSPSRKDFACDQASFIGDIQTFSGAEIPAGAPFTQTWRVKNTGACTWTPDYAVVYESGNAMNGPNAQKLGRAVLPGETYDISIVLTAPGEPGEFNGQWKLRNAAGETFGVGPSQDQALTVDIRVIPAPAYLDSYDFIDHACDATWFSDRRPAACLGTIGDPNGYVVTRIYPILESGYVDDEAALLISPPLTPNGVIYGQYPPITVQAHDHLLSIVSCEHNEKDCQVTFRLDYQIDTQPVQTLGAWREVYDGDFTPIDVDLSSLAGKNVQFILKVVSNSVSDQNRALWLHPRITRQK